MANQGFVQEKAKAIIAITVRKYGTIGEDYALLKFEEERLKV